jgi:hypothetical protein
VDSFKEFCVQLEALVRINAHRRYRFDRLVNYRRLELALQSISRADDKKFSGALTLVVFALRTFGNPDSRQIPESAVTIREDGQSLSDMIQAIRKIRDAATDLEMKSSGDIGERFREIRFAANNAEKFLGRRLHGLRSILDNRN